MPINKSAFTRYKILDQCFSNFARLYTLKDLKNEIEIKLIETNINPTISIRQLRYDISFMESELGFAINLERIKIEKKTYYRYSDPNYSISKASINQMDIIELKSIIETLERFRGIHHFEWITETITLINHSIYKIPGNKPVISYETNLDLKGREFIEKLYSLILNKTVIKIFYKSFSSDKNFIFIVHPYYLKEYNNRWFLFGLNEENNVRTWSMAIDRIESFTVLNNKNYVENKSINWEDYFSDIVGVTNFENEIINEVKLYFNKTLAHYIITKPIHESQKSKWLNKDILEVKIFVKLNIELENLLLSFGENCSIISPENLKFKLMNRVNKMIKNY